MRKLILLSVVVSMMLIAAPIAPASARPEAWRSPGQLIASFNAGLSGGNAVTAHSDNASSVVSPAVDPFGRLAPFGFAREVCNDTIVGTWVFYLASDGGDLDGWTTELSLDDVPLELQRTPWKPRLDGSGDMWYAEGVPVLGTLEVGSHHIDSYFSNSDGLTFGPYVTAVEVIDCV